MSSFLTRVSKKARDVLTALGDKSDVNLLDLLEKIQSAGGMGAELLTTHHNIIDLYTKSGNTVAVKIGQVVEDAYFAAIRMGHTYVGTEHLLLAALALAGFTEAEDLTVEIERLNSLPVLLKNAKNNDRVPVLNAFGIDLTRKYIFYPKKSFVDRAEVEDILKVLLQKNNSNVLLMGEKGSGKKSIIESMARKVSFLGVPAFFAGTYVIDFNMQAFLSGISPTAETFEGTIKNLASEMRLLGRSIVVIKQLPAMFSGSNAPVVASSVFRNFVDSLNEAGAKVIVCLDTDLGERMTPQQQDLFYGFTALEVKEPPKSVTMQILAMEAEKLEKYFFLAIPAKVLSYVYDRAQKDLKDESFPQKAVELLDKSCALMAFYHTKVPRALKGLVEKHVEVSLKIEKAFLTKDYDQALKLTRAARKLEATMGYKRVVKTYKARVLDQADVDRVLGSLQAEEEKEYKIGAKSLSDLEKRIKRRVIGQEKAIGVVVRSLVRSQMGLRPKNKPAGNFLFLGPTGVGKTELAKVLAAEAFGDGSLIRLDMSDFSEKHTVSRLVGAPPGYVGYNEGGELTTKISQKPQSVVLFDEVEKAHPEVLNILLQITEEGQLSDMKGESYDFSNAVIILTSNMGTDLIQKRGIGYGADGKSRASIEERITQSIKSFMKPELLNRFDEVVIFNELSKLNSEKILEILLADVHASLATKGIKLIVDKSVKQHLLEKGFSKEYGARALRRVVETELLDRIADFLLSAKRKKKPVKTLNAKMDQGSVIIG